MKVMTATEASRRFAAVLDEAEHGETIVVTRGGRRIAVIGPAPIAAGRSVKEMLRRHRRDDAWEDDLRAVRALVEDEPVQGVSRGPSAARADAQTPTGVPRRRRASAELVVADTTTVSDSSSALPDRRLDAVRIRQDPRDTPWCHDG